MISRILSGVRPTGHIHIGNYFGAIQQWVARVPHVDESLFCIVDQHALTTLEDSANLAQNCRTVAAAYIASGIDSTKSAIFLQSHVPYHTELAWYLNCSTPLGWLNRMTQFKDKAGKKSDQANLGLYAYPVLMAADILLYGATEIPVGEDQKQHVELARDIAQSFNHHYQCDVLTLPQPTILKETGRIMSLRDGSKKMSKSDLSDFSRIQLLDSDDDIRQKIKKAKTDPHPLPSSFEEAESRPEAFNLLSIYAACEGISLKESQHRFSGISFSAFKDALADALIKHLSPIRLKMEELLSEPEKLDNILKDGAFRARAIAAPKIDKVKETLGLIVI